jgi:hypothetical protein
MDNHVWRIVYSTVRSVNRSVPREGRAKRFSDVLIVGMYLWSVWHDRPLCWACDRDHYGSLFRPRRLPSVSQFCKRIKSNRCRQILTKVYERLARVDEQTYRCFLDARPLPIGPCSKDAEARAGRVYGGFARGYKVHELVFADGRTAAWSVMPLNVSEPVVARSLIDAVRPRGLLLADSNFDSVALYEKVARYGGRLLAVPRQGAGKGHVKQSEERLASIFLWGRVGRVMRRQRVHVERVLGNQSSYGGGLGPLPCWVRTLERARRWVGAKLILHHARLAVKRSVA